MSRSAVLLPAALVILASGCGGGSSQPSTTDCSVTGQNAQILTIMQSWYYWYQSLPASVDPSAYSSADALLDALREQPLDRFTYITTQAANQAFYGAGQYVGFGFGFTLDAANDMEITEVYAGSPASDAGLGRGDTVTEVNGVSVPSLVSSGQLESALSVSGTGVSATLAYSDLGGQSHTITMTSAVITQPSVALTAVIPQGPKKVGYILFESFIDTSSNLLDQAFSQFRAAGVTELVIDERYNGGGELSVAQHLGSMIVGNSYSGQTMGTLTYNDKHQDQNETISFETVVDPLNLKRVMFITSRSTASASEFTVNGLIPYLPTITVGTPTFGKPVGEQGFNICTNVLYPITFKISNSVGYGDYFGGLPATCPAADDLTHALGDPKEASLAAALGYLAHGSCGASAAAPQEGLREAQHPRETAPYTFRQLIHAY